MEPDTIDVEVTDHGTIVLFRPVSAAGSDWIAESVAEDALWFGGALAVERRYAGPLGEGIADGALKLARRPTPSVPHANSAALFHPSQ